MFRQYLLELCSNKYWHKDQKRNGLCPILLETSEIENLTVPTVDEVRRWAAHLAYCQFNETEMKDGTAWRILTNA